MVYTHSLSASREDTFDRCKLSYLFKYVDKIGIQTDSYSGHLVFGNFIHKIFELNPYAKTLKELEATAQSIQEQYKFPKDFNKKIKDCFINYLAFIASFPKSNEQPTPEWYFKLALGEKEEYLGVVDRVVKGKDGGILIIDWKTGQEKTKSKLANDRQLMGYVLACHIKFKVPISKIIASHYYPVSNTFVTVKFTKNQVLNFIKERKNKLWLIRKLKKSEFTPCRNEFCNTCDYKPLCPLFGGTAALYESTLQKDREYKKENPQPDINRGEPEEITLKDPVF